MDKLHVIYYYFVCQRSIGRQKSITYSGIIASLILICIAIEEILTYRRKDQQRRTESNTSVWIGTARAVSHNVNLNFSLSLCIR